MTPVTSLNGKHVAVFGLGDSGFYHGEGLVAGGAVSLSGTTTSTRERRPARRVSGSKILLLRTGGILHRSSFRRCSVNASGAALDRAEGEAGRVEIIGDIELFCRERQKIAPDSPFVAITGTNGKSTTTALVATSFPELRFHVEIGGNIGIPILHWRRRRKSVFMSSSALRFRSLSRPRSIHPWAYF